MAVSLTGSSLKYGRILKLLQGLEDGGVHTLVDKYCLEAQQGQKSMSHSLGHSGRHMKARD